MNKYFEIKFNSIIQNLIDVQKGVQSIIMTSILLFLEFELPVIDFCDLSEMIF
jgi:hypothetical protein